MHGPVAYGAGGDADEAGGSERISYDQMIVNGEFLAKIGICKNKPSSQIAMSITYFHHPGSPRWPCLLVASAAVWLSGRFLAFAERYRRWPRCALALLWLSDECGRIAWRMLTTLRG